MKIRTQLVLAWFLLSILPLSVIVLYSYHSSRRALEGAYHKEAQQLTAQMDRRLTTIRSDIDNRLTALSALPIETIPATSRRDPARAAVVDNILMTMGETAPLVDALEFVPAKPPAPVPVAASKTPAIAAVRGTAPPAAPTPPAPPAAAAIASDPNPNPDPAEPILIDLPPVHLAKFTMPPDFTERIAEITALSRQLSGNPPLTAEQRAGLQKTLDEKSRALEASMRTAKESYTARVREAERHTQQVRERSKEIAQTEKVRETRIATAVKPSPAAVPAPSARVRVVRVLSDAEKERLKANEKQTSLLFGRDFGVALQSDGQVLGRLRAQLSTHEIVNRILGAPVEDRTEIPFAIDREGNVYTRNDSDRGTLDRLGIVEAFKSRRPLREIEGWIIAVSEDKESGLRIGAARPVGENLQELRNTAARNFGYGIGLIAFALIGIVPLANHLTRDVKMVTDGASRIAQGDLQTRLPVRSKSEFGQLAVAFNRMAEDLSRNQQQIYEQERARREQEVQQRVLSLEYERKSVELEDARRFQLSMLPKQVPVHALFDIAVFTQTATEVGGDYYDFHVDGEDALSVAIGDATGHGAKAGTMVTVIKTLFSGYDASIAPGEFLRDAAEKIKRMDLGRMAMALSLARFAGMALTIAAAGMPPLLVHRNGKVDEVELPATPLGTLGVEYEQRSVTLMAGDTVLLMTDGFPELQDASGQQLGYTGAMQEFAMASKANDAAGVIRDLSAAARRWHGEQPPNDDITFVVVRCRA